MKRRSYLLTALQGFLVGAIVMAFIADYNRSQLPLAVLCLLASFLFDEIE